MQLSGIALKQYGNRKFLVVFVFDFFSKYNNGVRPDFIRSARLSTCTAMALATKSVSRLKTTLF
ncbi:hypothetical protein [Mucilaginibacter ginsenosidivorax]|uniref:Uncharacterized protein n=1 Tax=Mucilaginibacter ginsenosidivorax TaxID=862126 RepID=A0A5B8W0G7_9SPHI|nr:hypothetical protein [Mucilaginibacter ginsenosidivorax]QEC76276.1 hypothetical protein FSB76_10090 [Mucilaginibacter ginsenosidivorax]